MLFNLSNLIQNHKLNIKGVIQAGAHYGQEIEDFLKNDITNIICFEPCPEAFEKLKINFEFGSNLPTHQEATVLPHAAAASVTGIGEDTAFLLSSTHASQLLSSA